MRLKAESTTSPDALVVLQQGEKAQTGGVLFAFHHMEEGVSHFALALWAPERI